ncbi:NAD(P)H-hydrate dehydratase [Geodermatophilus sp. YIM 151500]|uniref:NAD(P)H-hydrate dehydratase n=1 Tax=Geodermatophilus sp. YIM 151500 TaxID=2984531 RepID=UPI0021E41C2E|nr:NAD(P)H-hydrate dehydratase [Geodermatophilus sp. YIM 151500]MCV2490140.1 NAD(P)H-hydrate dehydratase [Geodermatophilus sp. YIM 151500]
MSSSTAVADATLVTPQVLRAWRLPEPTGGKEARGSILVIGGSSETLGAVQLAAEAALRAGAGRLQVATAASVAPFAATALPEALVRRLPETSRGAIRADDAAEVLDLAEAASAVLIGPGMIDTEETQALGAALLPRLRGPLVLDALGLACVTADEGCVLHLEGRAVLTPNPKELALSLHRDPDLDDDDPAGSARELAGRAGATVGLGGATSWIAAPDGRLWRDESGGAGLGVSGSGDVRAGIVAGLLARGADPVQAAVWAAHLHGRAGERLAAAVGRLGFLARELPPEIPRVAAEIEL